MSKAELALPSNAADERHTTVLFAELQSAQPGASSADYLRVLGQAAELSGGRIVHKRENGVLALFASAAAAAAAAARMHTYADTLPQVAGKPGLRIGFHAGVVRQRDQDIFGDTVNLAIRVAEQAKDGQILVSHDTASMLSPGIQDLVRPVRCEDAEVPVGELAWRDAIKPITSAYPADAMTRRTMQIACAGKTLIRRRQGDSVSIGRDPGCDLPVEGAKVSRRHCTILLRATSLVLRDESSNGSFVDARSQVEILVRGSELPLGTSGCIGLGEPCSAKGVMVEYVYG